MTDSMHATSKKAPIHEDGKHNEQEFCKKLSSLDFRLK